MSNQCRLSRRMVLGGCMGLAGLTSNLLALSVRTYASSAHDEMSDVANMSDMPSMASNVLPGLTASMVGLPYQQGDVDPKINGFDPLKMMSEFDMGKVSKLPSGQTVRDYTLIATNKTIFLAPMITLPALVYNGRLPGPYLRATQGDRIRITFTNMCNVAHSINFAGLQTNTPNGKTPGAAFQSVPSKGQVVYEFDATQFGVYMYQAFTNPMALTTFRGLFGMFIIDPPQPRPKALELAMTMNAYPLKINAGENSPGNDVYAVNAVAFQFMKHPINIPMNQLVRVYLANATEFDRINSFHLHGNLFNLYRSGTSLKPDEFTDTTILCHGQTAILEFTFKFPGQYMFHAHQADFSDKGWTSTFNVIA